MTSLTGFSFSLPGGQFVTVTGASQYALPGSVFMSEILTTAALYLGIAPWFATWIVRVRP